MKALTVIRPMDWAIIVPRASTRKDVENRTWSPPPSVLGKFIAIHSGMGWSSDYARMVDTCLAPHWKPIFRDMVDAKTWPGGSIIGVVRVVDLSRVNPSPWAIEGNLHWRLADAFRLPRPVRARGMQKLWTVPEAVAAEVVRQCPANMEFA